MFNAKSYAASKRKGYRSGLEVEVQKQLTEAKLDVGYETIKIEWEDLAYRKYTPDFVLPNGVIIETKGLFTPSDRRKHILIQKQHPELDIRFIFTASKISSIDIKMTITFFLFKKIPITPKKNTIAPKDK